MPDNHSMPAFLNSHPRPSCLTLLIGFAVLALATWGAIVVVVLFASEVIGRLL